MYTLEDEQRELKLHGETAIPSGCYTIELVNSGRFGPDTLSLVDVPGFKYIRIHAGNSSADTEGCILVGKQRLSNRIADSRIALSELKQLVVPLIAAGDTVELYIHNAPGARYIDSGNDCPEYEVDLDAD